VPTYRTKEEREAALREAGFPPDMADIIHTLRFGNSTCIDPEELGELSRALLNFAKRALP
jgi:hypothetical protein